ncbi:MAG TPA: chemotaxis protein CheW, partial [Candidatus Dormibacteraeota bacterium]|nr:chemotaxis protein CheW [Candidatus Dormibacteraeota bacterium]
AEEYGIDILRVQEIRGFELVTKIANTPEFILGVIDLRGIIVPIVDLRIKFRLSTVEYDQFTVAIIINVCGKTMGIVVDAVSDVIMLAHTQIKPVPHMGTHVDIQYILGIASVEERMLILVDIEKLMSSEDMELVETAASA